MIPLTPSSTCGICGAQRGTETVCLQVLLFPPGICGAQRGTETVCLQVLLFPPGICGAQRGTETVCLQVLLFPPVTIIIYASLINYYILEVTDSNANLRIVGEPWKVTTDTHKYVLHFRGDRSQITNGC